MVRALSSGVPPARRLVGVTLSPSFDAGMLVPLDAVGADVVEDAGVVERQLVDARHRG